MQDLKATPVLDVRSLTKAFGAMKAVVERPRRCAASQAWRTRPMAKSIWTAR